MRESHVENTLRTRAKARRIYTRKFTSPSHAGVPDRLFAFNGRVLFLEVKRPGERPTELQKDEILILMGMGIPATWTDNPVYGKHLLDMLHAGDPGLMEECRIQNLSW